VFIHWNLQLETLVIETEQLYDSSLKLFCELKIAEQVFGTLTMFES